MLPETTIQLNPLALVLTLLMGILILVLPRRYATAPVIALACYLTMGQLVVVAGLHFSVVRIAVLFGVLRLILRGDLKSIRLNPIDKVLLCWALTAIVMYTLLWRTGDALIYMCGKAYDAIGLYFLARATVRSLDDAVTVFKAQAFLITPLAACMLLEKMTGRNVFGIFGGVSTITVVRDGVLRCQGPFGSAILAGTFGAASLALCVGLWWQGGSRRLIALAGMIACLVMAITSGSSGPIMTFLAGAFALSLFRWREHMRAARWALVFGVLCLQLVMKAPFWFVIAHLGVFHGSNSFYRANLIDQAIRHFSEWWLIGTKYQHPWAMLMTDICDMYVRIAMDGGLLTLILFLIFIKRSFSAIGYALRGEENGSLPAQHTLWALGAALFAHVMTFLSIWYWDQNMINLYFVFGLISSVAGGSFPARRLAPFSLLAPSYGVQPDPNSARVAPHSEAPAE